MAVNEAAAIEISLPRNPQERKIATDNFGIRDMSAYPGCDEKPVAWRATMSVVECDVPRHSALGKALIERADFRDAYRAPLTRSDLDVVDIFFGIFGERPGWMNLMLIARNKVVGLAGLEVPTSLEIMNMEKRDRYFVGEKIGPWPISSAPTNSLRAGTTSTWIIGSRS